MLNWFKSKKRLIAENRELKRLIKKRLKESEKRLIKLEKIAEEKNKYEAIGRITELGYKLLRRTFK